MRLADVMKDLKRMGTVQNRKVYARHGVSREMFGVSFANLGKLRKAIKTDQDRSGSGGWTWIMVKPGARRRAPLPTSRR